MTGQLSIRPEPIRAGGERDVKKALIAAGVQYAALPYRLVGRRVEIMLITSRATRRWVVPKGWPMKGVRPEDAAAREALEEAGLAGQIEDVPVGAYSYIKALKEGRAAPVRVTLFPLLVQEQAETWKEQGQRDRRWFPYHEAAFRVAEPGLRRLIRQFGRARSPRILRRPSLSLNLPLGLPMTFPSLF